jgi:hypothetical protein
MLAQRGRLMLNMEVEHWLALVVALPAVRRLPLNPLVALLATRLPEHFHADPADRFLVAQARQLGIPLMSADSRILAYSHGRSQWGWPVGLRIALKMRINHHYSTRNDRCQSASERAGKPPEKKRNFVITGLPQGQHGERVD